MLLNDTKTSTLDGGEDEKCTENFDKKILKEEIS
jgi:hypothetical protein